jgi:hypothetical protein
MLVTLACEASEASEACEFWECYCAFSCFTCNSRDARDVPVLPQSSFPQPDAIYKSMLVTLACEASKASEACEFWECYCAFSCFTSNSRERTVPNLQVDVGHTCMRGLRILRMLLYFLLCHKKYFEGHAHILSHYLV